MNWLAGDGGALIGLVGMVLLAVPAFKADKFARRDRYISEATSHPKTGKRLKDQHKRLSRSTRPVWRPYDTWLLGLGYSAIFLSYLGRLIA